MRAPEPIARLLRKISVRTRLYLLSALPLTALIATVISFNSRNWQEAMIDRQIESNLSEFSRLTDAIQSSELAYLSHIKKGDDSRRSELSERAEQLASELGKHTDTQQWDEQIALYEETAKGLHDSFLRQDDIEIDRVLIEFRKSSYQLGRMIAEHLIILSNDRSYSDRIRHYVTLRVTNSLMDRVMSVQPEVLAGSEVGEALFASIRDNLGILTSLRKQSRSESDVQSEKEQLEAIRIRGEKQGLALTQEDVELSHATEGAIFLIGEFYSPIAQSLLRETEKTLFTQLRSQSKRTLLVIGVSLIGSLFSVILAFVLTRAVYQSIAPPLEELTKAAQRMEQGNLSSRLDASSGDEIGEVARGFKKLELTIEALENEFKKLEEAASSSNLQARGDITKFQGQWLVLINRMNRALDQLDVANSKLLDAQRMEVYAKMSGGIAHQFNNLLTVIIGNTELEIEASTNQRKNLDAIVQAGRRAQSLVAQLRALGSENGLQLGSVSLVNSLKQLEEVGQQLLPDRIALDVLMPAKDVLVVTDKDTILQALTHLLLNARDALEEGGSVRVEVGMRKVQGGDSVPDWVKPGVYGTIQFQDDGPGIAPDALPRVFEPFFTTKDLAASSGLGLSMVYGFTRQCGGWTAIDSKVGGGTQVTMHLPESTVSSEKDNIRPSVKGELVETSDQNRLVLLVEDDLLVRRLTHTMLKKLGYQVVEAQDGKEGLEALHEYHGQLSLIVSDVLMPHYTGPQMVAEFLKTETLECGVLFVTGFSANELPAQIAELGGHFDRLNKPFSASDLESKMNGLLALSS